MLAAACLVGCSFDASDLSERDGCRSDADCVRGVCSLGHCVRVDPDASGSADGSQDCAPALHNACGGCATLQQEPGSPCDASCGTWECAGADTVTCTPGAVDACGGCGEPGVPGAACGVCGVLGCAGGQLGCLEQQDNACGGCGPLQGTPGTPCSDCGGVWTCDGTGLAACVGGASNPCGGCDGTSQVELGAVCACDGTAVASSARWECDGADPVCSDNNDVVADALDLGTFDDTRVAPIIVDDALQLADDIDWYQAHVVDRADADDGLYPAVSVQDGANAPVVCVFWLYDDRRAWDMGCAEGVLSTYDDLFGCCSTGTLGGRTGAAVVDDSGLDPRLDGTTGEGNDGGTVYVAVFDDAGLASCSPYRLDLTL